MAASRKPNCWQGTSRWAWRSEIEAKGLKCLDLEKTAGQPELGARIGLVGYAGGKLTRHTLNLGIVSAPSRNRACSSRSMPC